jgi:DNA mismatch repair protein MutL
MDYILLRIKRRCLMSAKVRILPEQLANKIAAGEVVERPASVVKELVENSLDAGATEVIVEIEDGGKKLIRVIDNGSGMSKEDALLSLERHATSKISSDTDLFNLHTLGFRGEAIPSIASVSRFLLSTREKECLEGVEIYAEGGRIKEVKACGMAAGTSIAIRNLFFNTPARLKFMRSRETELGHINEIIHRLALSRPEVRFSYTVDSKPVFSTLSGDMTARTRELLGRNLAREMYPVETEENDITLQGLLGSPSVSRSTAASIYTFINGRYVRDRVVQHAIIQAYRNVLERGRYPALVLFIGITPEDVDVNVHPTKHEVRFREQSKVHQTISGAIETVLRSTPWLNISTRPAILNSSQPARTTQSISRVEEVRDSLLRYSAAITPQQFGDSVICTGISGLSDNAQAGSPLDSPETDLSAKNGFFSSLQVIGQFRAAYILCQEGADLVIIDQHAAHERVVFEELRSSFRESALESQQLLFPETLELLPNESAALNGHNSLLLKLGFDVEHFGGNTWLLNSVPLSLSGYDHIQALRDLLEEIAGIGFSHSLDEKVEDLLATIACHSVVRGERHLSMEAIQHLFKRMDSTGFSAHCPHGRPAVSRISLRDIEKLFKRT